MATKNMTPKQQASEWLLNCHILVAETTGLDDQAEIVEISIIDQQGQVVLDTLVKPQKPIPDYATATHGITNDMVATAPSWTEIHDEVYRIIGSKPLVIYNADDNMRLMAQTAAQYGLQPVVAKAEVHCAMLTYAEFNGDWNEYKGAYRCQRLTNAAQQRGVVIEGTAHRALADVKMTLGVIKAMAQQQAGSV
jgi:DNA polymerase-3 subunit epsilon